MKITSDMDEIFTWKVQCCPFDYAVMAQEAEQQMLALKERLAMLKSAPLKLGEKELIRRRRIKLLTDMYREQRGNFILFTKRAQGVPSYNNL